MNQEQKSNIPLVYKNQEGGAWFNSMIKQAGQAANQAVQGVTKFVSPKNKKTATAGIPLSPPGSVGAAGPAGPGLQVIQAAPAARPVSSDKAQVQFRANIEERRRAQKVNAEQVALLTLKQKQDKKRQFESAQKAKILAEKKQREGEITKAADNTRKATEQLGLQKDQLKRKQEQKKRKEIEHQQDEFRNLIKEEEETKNQILKLQKDRKILQRKVIEKEQLKKAQALREKEMAKTVAILEEERKKKEAITAEQQRKKAVEEAEREQTRQKIETEEKMKMQKAITERTEKLIAAKYFDIDLRILKPNDKKQEKKNIPLKLVNDAEKKQDPAKEGKVEDKEVDKKKDKEKKKEEKKKLKEQKKEADQKRSEEIQKQKEIEKDIKELNKATAKAKKEKKKQKVKKAKQELIAEQTKTDIAQKKKKEAEAKTREAENLRAMAVNLKKKAEEDAKNAKKEFEKKKREIVLLQKGGSNLELKMVNLEVIKKKTVNYKNQTGGEQVLINQEDMEKINDFDDEGDVTELQTLISGIIDKSNIENKKNGDFEIDQDKLVTFIESEDINTIRDNIINSSSKIVTDDNLTEDLESEQPIEEDVIEETEELNTVDENVVSEEEIVEEAVEEEEEEEISNQVGTMGNEKKDTISNFLNSLCSRKLLNYEYRNISKEIKKHSGFFQNQPWRYDVLRFKACDEINFNHILDDGFWDGGKDAKDKRQNIYNTNYQDHDTSLSKGRFNKESVQNREIILVDKTNDKRLKEIIKKTKESVKKINEERSKVERIIEIIDKYIGNLNETLREQVSLGNANIMDLMTYNSKNNSSREQTIIVKLGDIGSSIPLKNNPNVKKRFAGLSRHKCILFKYLCDELNIKSSLFRDPKKFKDDETQFDGHYWNGVVLDDKKIYIYDPRYFSGSLQSIEILNNQDYRISDMEKSLKKIK
jgi:hypothetical protein